MGCLLSTESGRGGLKRPSLDRVTGVAHGQAGQRFTSWVKPKWKSEEPLTADKINKMREEFWDTQPHYGGSREIWDALKAACEMTDMDTSKLIIESAGIVVAAPDMTVCYDERGAKYDLPKFVLSYPQNMAS